MSEVSEERIRAWADEAEAGYDVAMLQRRAGRPRLDIDGPATVVPVRLTPAQLERLDARVAAGGGSRSQVLRAAVDAYLAS